MTDFPTSADSFAGPPPAQGFFSPSNHKNALGIFVAKVFEPNKVMPFGTRDCTTTAVFIIAGEGAGAEWPAAEITGVRMSGQLAGCIGSKVLGRIVEQGSGAKKPFVIASPTAEDIALGNQWLSNPRNAAKVERALRAAEDAGLAKPAPQPAAAGTDLPAPPPVTVRDADEPGY
jgi:hypothetical protein